MVFLGAPPRDELYDAVAEADVMLTELTPVDGDLLDHAPNLRGVVVYGVGTEKVDLNAAKERGVVVAHTPDAFTSEVAEHAIALLLALARCVTDSDADVRERHLWRTYDDTFRPRRLRGSTLGVLGYGRIGRATAALAAGFGTRLVVFDPFLPDGSVDAAGLEPRCAWRAISMTCWVRWMRSPSTCRSPATRGECSARRSSLACAAARC